MVRLLSGRCKAAAEVAHKAGSLPLHVLCRNRRVTKDALEAMVWKERAMGEELLRLGTRRETIGACEVRHWLTPSHSLWWLLCWWFR